MIRAATKADLQAVLRLERASFDQPHWREADFEAAMRQDSAVSRALLLDVEDGAAGSVVRGFGVVSAITALYPVEAEIQNLAVAKEYRRLGVGRAVLRAMLAWCEAKQAEVIRLEVRLSNTGAVRLYEELGFQVTGRRAGYYVNPLEDALLMELRPAPAGDMAPPPGNPYH